MEQLGRYQTVRYRRYQKKLRARTLRRWVKRLLEKGEDIPRRFGYRGWAD